MAKLLKIRKVIEKCEDCPFHNWFEEKGIIKQWCNHHDECIVNLTKKESETFPTWCPLNDYPYNA